MSQCTLSQEIYSIFSFVNFRTGDIARNFHGKFIALSFWWCFIMRFTSFFHRVFPYRCFIASWTPKFGTHWNIDSIRGEMNETYGLDSHAKVGGKNWRPMSFFRLGMREVVHCFLYYYVWKRGHYKEFYISAAHIMSIEHLEIRYFKFDIISLWFRKMFLKIWTHDYWREFEKTQNSKTDVINELQYCRKLNEH